MNNHFADRMASVKPSAIRSLNTNPDMIFFGGGYPDASLFPVEALQKAYQDVLQHSGAQALQYSFSAGLPVLREQIARRMKDETIECSTDNILVLQGAQQGLDLVASLLVNKGDVIITEAPTFLGALGAFAVYEPEYETVPVDGDGLDVAVLEQILKTTKNVKFLYTIPDYHNPTGVTMSLERRKALIELANRYDLVILEDTPYREVYFDKAPPPALKSMDTEGRVIYLGSFSKILSPGLRMGWAVASEEMIRRLTLLKLGADTQCSTLNMSAISYLLENYDLESHIKKIRASYMIKRDILINAMRENFSQEIAFTYPDGGLFTWLTFPSDFNSREFLLNCAIPQFNVGYVPGDAFYAKTPEHNHARVSFSTVSAEDIQKGISLLGEAYKQYR